MKARLLRVSESVRQHDYGPFSHYGGALCPSEQPSAQQPVTQSTNPSVLISSSPLATSSEAVQTYLLVIVRAVLYFHV